jgi:hypothetical protein
MVNKSKHIAIRIFLFAGILTTSCKPSSEKPLQTPQSKQAILKYIDAGFVEGYGTNRLFCDESSSDKFSRMKTLLTYLGYSDFEWVGFSVSSDQRYLRFREHGNPSNTRVLVFGKDTKPKIYEFPQAATGFLVLDNNNIPVLWSGGTKPRGKVVFANGETIQFPAQFIISDNAGEYFCSGGLYFDYESQTRKTIPLNIYSVHNPSKPLVRSNLPKAPDKIFTTEKKVYLVMRNSQNGQMPYGITCEIYSREANGLKLTKEFIVKCPLHFGARWLYPECFD